MGVPIIRYTSRLLIALDEDAIVAFLIVYIAIWLQEIFSCKLGYAGTL